jgi:hypothetical protein
MMFEFAELEHRVGKAAYEAAVCDMVDRTSTRVRAVDPGRGEQQVLRAHQGPENLV